MVANAGKKFGAFAQLVFCPRTGQGVSVDKSDIIAGFYAGVVAGVCVKFFAVDARFDKSFTVANNLNVNIFLRIQNLLDTRNVSDVYRASGSAEDDGYLASTNGQNTVETFEVARPNDLEAYRHSYLMRMINPDFFFTPRRIFIGAVFDF